MKTMNRFVMVIWGFCIFSLWAIIILIAYKTQDRTYYNLTRDLRKASIKYIEKNKIKLSINESYKIYTDDLKKDNFITDKDEILEKYCIDSIVVQKDIFDYDYTFNKNCKE